MAPSGATTTMVEPVVVFSAAFDIAVAGWRAEGRGHVGYMVAKRIITCRVCVFFCVL